MVARWLTLGVWALVAAAATGWGLRVFVQSQPVPAGTPVADAAPVLQADLTRLLGADPALPAAAPEAAAPVPETSFRLVGVVAPRSAAGTGRSMREGVALIAVGDRPPRAFRVGSPVDGDTVLQAVSARGAELGLRGGPVQATLHLPALPPPASGMLPTAPAPVPTLPPTSAQRSPLNRPTPLPLPAQPPASPQPDNGSPPPVDSPPRNPNPTLM